LPSTTAFVSHYADRHLLHVRRPQSSNLPTGRFAVDGVLHIAISEFGARPRRVDSDDILDRKQTRLRVPATSPRRNRRRPGGRFSTPCR